MVTAIVIGAIIGFILAMPPGPIAMSVIKTGLDEGRKEAFQMSIGTAMMDMLYCAIAVFTASAIDSTITEFFIHNPVLLLFFQISVILGFITFGIYQFKKKQVKQINSNSSIHTPKFIDNLTKRGPFLFGIALALTNIANPTFFPSLTIISAWIHKFNLFNITISHNIIFSVGFGLGNFAWLYLLAFIVMKNKHKLSDMTIFRIRQFAGLTFIGFGGIIGYRVVVFTNWAQIFKFVLAI
jgi:threonine/homoserine/homoserine lactone efflux protein